MSKAAKTLESHIRKRFSQRILQVKHNNDIPVHGQLTRMVGLTLEAVGCPAPIGSKCLISSIDGGHIEAEVVGFHKEKTYLMANKSLRGLRSGAQVVPVSAIDDVPVGEQLLGRILDGSGQPIDGGAPLMVENYYPLDSTPMNPLQRATIRQPLDVGIRGINGLLTIGRGQRIGLFAGSGVGKSVLLGMMTRYTSADIVVVGLIGERGREVKEFIEHSLGSAGLARSIVVAAPADNTPLMRLHGAMMATSIAEYFRDRGANVLLLMDSLTRYAQAQRELSLAIGEPPATKGYTPSVFAKLASLVERAGNAEEGGGSITAFYTVLTEGDDTNDPVADAARAILDGHIVLSRELAEAGHYPAIDIDSSISRVMSFVTSPEQQQAALQFKRLYAKYQQNKDLITVGAYTQGTDPEIDMAIANLPRLFEFLHQGIGTQCTLQEAQQTLMGLVSEFTVINNETIQTNQTVGSAGPPSRTR